MLTPFLGAIKKKCAENFEINALMRKNLLCKWHIVKVIQNEYYENEIVDWFMLVLNEKVNEILNSS